MTPDEAVLHVLQFIQEIRLQKGALDPDDDLFLNSGWVQIGICHLLYMYIQDLT